MEIIEKYLEQNPKYGQSFQKIGGGNFGIVFKTNKNFVIKITKDNEEFQTTKKIKENLNGKYTPYYYELIELKNNSYLIVMDYIEPIDLSSNENVILNLFRDKLISNINFVSSNINKFKENIKNLDNNLRILLNGVLDAAVGLFRIGIKNIDIHEDNIGLLNNKIVFIDVVSENIMSENKKLKKLIENIINKHLKKINEVRYINPKYPNILNEPPLRDSEKIRVFHGFYMMERKTHPSERGWDVSDHHINQVN